MSKENTLSEEQIKEKRKKELIDWIGSENSISLFYLVDEAVDLEVRLSNLRKLPFVKFKLDDPSTQVRTDASKEYHDCLNNYIAVMKTLSFISGKTSDKESESPLVAYLNNQK